MRECLGAPMMRLLLASLAAILLLAGCLTPDATPDETNTTAPTTPGLSAALPAPIEDSKEVSGSGDPLNLVPGTPPCSSPSAQCFPYPFELNATATITADLSWTAPASDFDFYVLQDGAIVLNGASDVTAGPGTSEHIEGELEPGAYELTVVAWSVARDTYTLSATFAAGATSTALGTS